MRGEALNSWLVSVGGGGLLSDKSAFRDPVRVTGFHVVLPHSVSPLLHRLHIKLRKRPAPQAGTPSPVRPRPQVEKQTVNEANISSTATGYVQIINVDPNGKYVQIKNMADQVRHAIARPE